MANNELSLSSLGIQLPYNMQAEQSVLGAALMDETILNRLITEMDPDMFYSEQNRAVYEEMRRLFSESEAVDVITLVDSLAQNGVFKGADDAKVYITRIAETVPAISNVDSYIKIVKEKYQTRRLIEAARDILQQSSEESDSDLLLESAEQKLYDIRNGQDRSGVKTIQESILEVIDTMQKLSGADRDKFAGIPTGFNYLDNILTGLGRSDLIILAARPGMGKTSFALNIATNVARLQKIPTVIFSLEMTCEQLTDRILSSTAGIDSQAFRTGRLNNSDWNDFANATSLLYNVPIYMDDSSGISVPEIKAKIRQINQDPKRDKIGLVIIDYLQLMQSAKRTESRVQEISDITRNLKIMAKELNVPVIALSQLSRAAEKQRVARTTAPSFQTCVIPALSNRMRTWCSSCTALPITIPRTAKPNRRTKTKPNVSWPKTAMAKPVWSALAGMAPIPGSAIWTRSMNSTDADNSLQNPVNTMEQTLLAYCRRQGLFRLGDRVIVACSGGADSMALLCFLLRCKAELGITVMAAHVDHGIRGEAAHADARFVAEFCRTHHVPFFCTMPLPAGCRFPQTPARTGRAACAIPGLMRWPHSSMPALPQRIRYLTRRKRCCSAWRAVPACTAWRVFRRYGACTAVHFYA